TYQWRFNGTAISGATNTSFLIPNVQDSAAGTYSALAGNLNLVASSNAVLTVNHPPVALGQVLGRQPFVSGKVRWSSMLGSDPDGDAVLLSSAGPGTVA